ILRLFFTKFIPRFILDNPDAYIEIVEAGTLELREMLMDQTIHAAILVEPAELQPEDFEVYQLMRTEIVAFMDPNHPLSKKRLLKWSDLNDYPFATYNEKDKVIEIAPFKQTFL